MQFTINSGEFANAISWASRALAARPPIVVLSGLLVTVADDKVNVSAFDYEQSALATLPLTGFNEPGEMVIPGRLLADIVKSLGKRDMTLTLEGSRVIVTSGSARFTVPTLPVADYPALPAQPDALGTVDAIEFADAVRKVAVAAGTDDTLPVLTSVSVTINPDGLMTLAATDRYRLAVQTLMVNLSRTLDEPLTLLVPARNLEGYAKALSADGTLTFGAPSGTSGMFGITGKSQSGTSRLLDGDYPKYARLLPESFNGEAKVATGDLVDVVKRSKLVAMGRTITLLFEDNALVVTAGRDEALARESIPVEYDGEPFTISFNHDYLLDGLAAVDGADVRFLLTSENKPAVLRTPEDDALYTYLMMPVRVAS